MRGEKVLPDRDLASLYAVAVGNLNRAVTRNKERFPPDFMFQLTRSEYDSLRCQFGILEKGKHSKYLPYVFTEQGVAILSGLLRSEKAVQVNIAIMRVFVQMRRFVEANKDVLAKVKELEETMEARFSKQDEKPRVILQTIKQMISDDKKKKTVGFHVS